jgi:hypothetical protein
MHTDLSLSQLLEGFSPVTSMRLAGHAPTDSLPVCGAAATYGKEAPTLTLDQRDFLPPAPKDSADNEGDEESSW